MYPNLLFSKISAETTVLPFMNYNSWSGTERYVAHQWTRAEQWLSKTLKTTRKKLFGNLTI